MRDADPETDDKFAYKLRTTSLHVNTHGTPALKNLVDINKKLEILQPVEKPGEWRTDGGTILKEKCESYLIQYGDSCYLDLRSTGWGEFMFDSASQCSLTSDRTDAVGLRV